MDNTFATIISMLPYEIIENKPGLTPKEYIIKKAPMDDFTLNIIPNNVFYMINPDPLSDAKNVQFIKVPVPAIEVAESVINDYVLALLAVDPPDAIPGLFAVRGDFTDKKEAAIKFMKEIVHYKTTQGKWFQNLVNIADDVWSKTHSPVGISDIMRDACRALGYKRDWLNPVPFEQVSKCPICKNPINEGALKCVACDHILNKSEYDKVLTGAK